MKTKTTRLFCHPGYEDHIAMMLDTDSGGKVSTAEIQAMIKAYTLSEGMKMYDINIPGPEEGKELMLRVITPVEQPENMPIVMDIHGGNFTAGNVDIDNYRCIALASMTPCIAVSVEYRLASRDLPFPAQLMDCLQAYRWLTKNSKSIGGDPSRIALHGTSAGGTLAAALALWLRDHGEQAPALTVLNCPLLTDRITPSKLQFGSLSGIETYCDSVEAVYMNVHGQYQSYYAMPLYCGNLQGLGPHMIITAEYDPLRDEGLEYARNLMYHSVPCEILSAPRVTHGFCVIDQPLTRYVHRSIAASLRREFEMPITEY